MARGLKATVLIIADMPWSNGLLSRKEGSSPLRVLGKSLPDSGPQLPHLSDGLQFAWPIFSGPLGGSIERREEGGW